MTAPLYSSEMSSKMAASLPLDASVGELWLPGPREPRLARGETHLWRADLRTLDEQLLGLLDEAERERASQIVRAPVRQLWRRSRGLLRLLLGRYTCSDPSALSLVRGERGKPELDGGAARALELSFNLSHSRHLALYAFAAGGEIGVDVQLPPAREDRATDYVALAKRAFGMRAAQRLAQLERPLREREFLRLWTRHEAKLKLHGAGAAAWVGSCSGARECDGEAQGSDGASVIELDVGPEAAAALARSRELRPPRLWEWTG
jgi:4'-phosphopantetheinyl transferase